MTALPVKRKLKAKRRMGVFFVDCEVENVREPGKKDTVHNLLVDTGSLYTWLPAEVLKRLDIEVFKKSVPFVMANGKTVARPTGHAVLRAAGFATLDEVVFARPDDMSLLGAKTLQGFGAMVDPTGERLVDSGPRPAALARRK